MRTKLEAKYCSQYFTSFSYHSSSPVGNLMLRWRTSLYTRAFSAVASNLTTSLSRSCNISPLQLGINGYVLKNFYYVSSLYSIACDNTPKYRASINFAHPPQIFSLIKSLEVLHQEVINIPKNEDDKDLLNEYTAEYKELKNNLEECKLNYKQLPAKNLEAVVQTLLYKARNYNPFLELKGFYKENAWLSCRSENAKKDYFVNNSDICRV